MVYAYDSSRGNSMTRRSANLQSSSRNLVEGYEDHSTNYTLRVMPYDEDLREDFIDLTQPSNVPIFLLIAVIIVLVLLYSI